jgi:hypothetical protein
MSTAFKTNHIVQSVLAQVADNLTVRFNEMFRLHKYLPTYRLTFNGFVLTVRNFPDLIIIKYIQLGLMTVWL